MDVLIPCNVGPNERLLRMGVGLAAATGAVLTQNRAAKIALGALGFSGLATAATRYCPVNRALGINNCQAATRSLRQIIRRL